MNDHDPMKQLPKSPPPNLWIWSPISYLAMGIAAPYYLFRMLTTHKYRSGLRQRLTRFTEEEIQCLRNGPSIWVHTVSVGELMAARPLLRRLKSDFPHFKILVTTVTDTGQELAHKIEEVDYALYLPLDIFPLCKKVIEWVRPACILILETEIWPNFLRAASYFQIPLYLINARLSDKSLPRYAKFRKLFSPLLSCFTSILAQSEEDARRFRLLGVEESSVQPTGNLKFEAVALQEDGEMRREWRERFQIADKEILLLGGSTFPGEEALLVRIFKQLRAEKIPLRLVIAPRHVERAGEIENDLRPYGFPLMRRSLLTEKEPLDPRTVILLDTIGELRHVYAAAELVFVGKSLMGQGGQNPIEPAAWGRAILFGKNMQNFRDVAALFTRAEAARSVADEKDFLDSCRELCASSELRAIMGNRARDVVRSNQGALGRIISVLQPVLQAPESTP